MAQTFLFVLTIHLWLAAAASAQILQADWTKEADQQIEKHRKVPVRVIVLDRAGKPVANAAVRLEQKRHAFAWGVVPRYVVPETEAEVRAKTTVSWFEGQSAVSSEEWTRWVLRDQPEKGELASYRRTGLPAPSGHRQRWGVLVWSDPGSLPNDVLTASRHSLELWLLTRITEPCGRPGVDEFDVYADNLERDFVAQRFGPAMVRRMFELAKATAPNARMCVRFSDVFEGDRSIRAARKVTALRDGFVPVDAISIDGKFRGTVVQTMVKRQLDSLAGLQMPITVARLEVGGESEAAAAINLETVLRTLFAERMVQGIYMVGFSAEEVADPNARLTDDRGKSTDAGRLLNKLVHELWWTDEFAKSDHLGNAKARVFAGTYKLTAALPGERSPAEITVYLPAGESERIVVLQPLALPAEPELDLRPKSREP